MVFWTFLLCCICAVSIAPVVDEPSHFIGYRHRLAVIVEENEIIEFPLAVIEV